MNQDQILFAAHAGVCCLKLRGELRHTLADAIDDLGEQLFAGRHGECRHLVIDLCEARFMDSTVIGLLVGLARELRARSLPAPTLACSNPEIVELINHLRLNEVFRVVGASEALPADLAAVNVVEPASENPLRQARMILKAHEALIAANEGNREEFAMVVDMFRQEVERLGG